MIPIRKPSEPPSVLRDKGKALTAELCRLADAGDLAAMKFDHTVYGAREVKRTLRAAQHDKCCFCESQITAVAFGDVEHFRPKASVRQSLDEPERKPGYYWLAYDWANLYLSCEQCNRRHKQSLFPLQDDTARVRSHRDARRVRTERPMFIDPGREDPAQYVGFRRAYAGPVAGSRRGELTIGALGLNRIALRERRQSRRELLLGLLGCVRSWLSMGSPPLLRADAERAARLLLQALDDRAEYAAMARATVRDAMPWRSEPWPESPGALLEALALDAEQGRWLAIPPR